MIHFFLFIALCCCTGWFLLRRISGADFNASDGAIFCFPVGSALITLALFTLNQLCGININLISVTIVSIGLAFACAMPLTSSRSATGGRGPSVLYVMRPSSFYEKISLFYIIIAFLVFLTYKIMAPVYFWDAWCYHLPIAEKIFHSGQLPTDVSLTSAEIVNAYPAFIPILYGIEDIAFGYPHYWLIKIISFVFAWFSCLLVYRICRSGLNDDIGSALSAIIICLSMEMFLFYSVFASTSIAMNFFCLGAVYFLVRYHLDRNDRFLYLIGLNLGFAYWVEYPGALFSAVFILALLLLRMTQPSREGITPLRLWLTEATKICIPAFCIALPHLVRNLLLFGNPVYPALAGFLGGKNIDAWAMQHSTNLPGLKGFALWFDVLHWGFLAPLFFVLYLFRRKWRESSIELFSVVLYLAYYVAYLLTLRYPPTVGDSSKFLLPILCLAAAMGGSVMKDMFTKGLRIYETAALVLMLAAWQIVTCRNELLLDTERYWPIANPASWNAWLAFFNGVIFDFHQTGLIVVVILCYVLNTAKVSPWIKKSLLTLAMAIFMGQVFQQIVFPLIWHIERAHEDPSYHYIEYINPRWLQPEGEWMEKNLPVDAVLLSFDSRFYIVPRKIVPADSYQLKELYQAKSIDEAVHILKSHGVTHIHLNEMAYGHPLYRELPFLNSLEDRRYFSLIYEHNGRVQGTGSASGIKVYELH